MNAQPRCHGAEPPLLGEPGAKRVGHPCALARRQLGERREPFAGQLLGEALVASQQQPPACSLATISSGTRRQVPARPSPRAPLTAALPQATVVPSPALAPASRTARSSAARRPGPSGSGITATSVSPIVSEMASTGSREATSSRFGPGDGEHGDCPRKRPPGLVRGGPDDAHLGRRLSHQHPHKPPATKLGFAGHRGLLERVALGRLGREHVDVGEDRLRQQVEGLGLEPRGDTHRRKPPPGDAGADPVGREQRLETPSRSHLAAAERRVHVGPRDRPARLDLGKEVAQRLLYAGPDALAERAVDRPRVRRDRAHRVDHLAGDVRQHGTEHAGDLGRKLVPRLIGHFLIWNLQI